MLLKFIEAFASQPAGLDSHRIIEVDTFSISDSWYTYDQLHVLIEGEYCPYTETIFSFDKVHAPSTNWHQIFVVEFSRNNSITKIATNMPIYAMNDNGKTIQSYNPYSVECFEPVS